MLFGKNIRIVRDLVMRKSSIIFFTPKLLFCCSVEEEEECFYLTLSFGSGGPH